MTDWFGEAPVIPRELAPSHFEYWYRWCIDCRDEGRNSESVVYVDGKWLCVECAESNFELAIYQESLIK